MPDDSHPCAGQIDGVAAASAFRFSTVERTSWSRDSRPSRTLRRRPNVSSGEANADSVFAYALCCVADWGAGVVPRSEEHTSELQSQSNLVCRLLLEKKK